MQKTEYKLEGHTTILKDTQVALRIKFKDIISIFEIKYPNQHNTNYRM